MGKADNMDRIQKIFRKCRDEKRKALVIFNSCGLPDEKSSEELIGKSIEAGADIIELGVPFSDPIADGVMIQKASQIALKNGITLKKILAMAQRIHAKYPDTGLILFSYFNVMMNYGLEALAAKLEQIGVDGILAVDAPYEESGELKPLCAKHHLHLIPLVSPTTGLARAEMIMRDATGFVYYVTVRGVTGERSKLPPELAERLAQLRSLSPVPVVAGFGISTEDAARAVAKHADGVVVGSAAIHPMFGEENISERQEKVAVLVKSLARGVSHAE